MIKRIIGLALLLPLLNAPTACAQIPAEVTALIEDLTIAKDQCFEQLFDEVKPACDTRQVLREKIEQAGWCYRWPMEGEKDGTYVGCSANAFQNSYIDIDLNSGKPILTERFAKWEMDLFDKGMNGQNPVDNKSIGNLTFSCNKNSDPKATILINDNSSGFTSEMFEAELKINFKNYPVDVEISRPGSDFTKVVFGKENTLELLKWVDESTGRSGSADFKARETGTEHQIHFMLHNLTTKNRYAAEVKNLLSWTSAMQSRCNASNT